MGAQNSKVSSKDKAILEMKLQRDKLKQFQRKIELVLEKETEIAAECIARGDTGRAMLALRQKKFQKNQLRKTDEQLDILETLVWPGFPKAPKC